MEGGEIWETTDSASIFLITSDMVPCKKRNKYIYTLYIIQYTIYIIYLDISYTIEGNRNVYLYLQIMQKIKTDKTDHETLILLESPGWI